MRGWPSLLGAGAAAGLSLLATASVAAPPLSPAIERGADIAQTHCAACHGVALETASPSREAPLFRVLSRLYSTADLVRKLDDIAQNGHFEMPRVRIRDDEIEDVAAYIVSLEGGAAARPSPGRPPPARKRPITGAPSNPRTDHPS